MRLTYRERALKREDAAEFRELERALLAAAAVILDAACTCHASQHHHDARCRGLHAARPTIHAARHAYTLAKRRLLQ